MAGRSGFTSARRCAVTACVHGVPSLICQFLAGENPAYISIPSKNPGVNEIFIQIFTKLSQHTRPGHTPEGRLFVPRRVLANLISSPVRTRQAPETVNVMKQPPHPRHVILSQRRRISRRRVPTQQAPVHEILRLRLANDKGGLSFMVV